MLELHPKVVVRDGQHSQPLVTNRLLRLPLFILLAQDLRQRNLQKLVLQQDDRQHHVLQGVFVPVQLAEDCAQVQVSVCQGLRLLQAQLQFQSLDEVSQGCPDFSRPTVVARQVVISSGLKLNGVPADQLSLLEAVQAQLKLLLLKVNHGSQVQILAQLVGSLIELGVIHPEYILLDAQHLLHDVDALRVLGIFC